MKRRIINALWFIVALALGGGIVCLTSCDRWPIVTTETVSLGNDG